MGYSKFSSFVSWHIRDQGKSIAYGSPKEIQQNKQVIDSYLGTFDAT